MGGKIAAVSSNGTYSFTKPNRESVTLLAGFGVEGMFTAERRSSIVSG